MTESKKLVQFYATATPQSFKFGLDGPVPAMIHSMDVPQTWTEIFSAIEGLAEFRRLTKAVSLGNGKILKFQGPKHSVHIKNPYNHLVCDYELIIRDQDYKTPYTISSCLDNDNFDGKVREYTAMIEAAIENAKKTLLVVETPKPASSVIKVVTVNDKVKMDLTGPINVTLLHDDVFDTNYDLDKQLEKIGYLQAQVHEFRRQKTDAFCIDGQLEMLFGSYQVHGNSYNVKFTIYSIECDRIPDVYANISHKEFTESMNSYLEQLRNEAINMREKINKKQ